MEDVRERRWSWCPKNVFLPCQHLRTVSSLLQICRMTSALYPDDVEQTPCNLRFCGGLSRALHHQACLHWCHQYVHWNLNMWRNTMFNHESRSCLCSPLQIRDSIQNLGVEWMVWHAGSNDINPTEYLFDQLERAVQLHWLMTNAGWRMGHIPIVSCDQHEEAVPVCLYFHKFL